MLTLLSSFLATAAGPRVDDPVAIILIGGGLLILVYLLFLRPKAKGAKRRKDPLSTPASQRQSLAAQRSTEREMQSLVLELESLARKMGGQMDTKARKLEALIEQSDERIAHLERLMSQAKAADLADAVVEGRSGRAESGLAALGRHNDIYALADAGKSPAAIAQELNRPAGEIELILALRE